MEAERRMRFRAQILRDEIAVRQEELDVIMTKLVAAAVKALPQPRRPASPVLGAGLCDNPAGRCIFGDDSGYHPKCLFCGKDVFVEGVST